MLLPYTPAHPVGTIAISPPCYLRPRSNSPLYPTQPFASTSSSSSRDSHIRFAGDVLANADAARPWVTVAQSTGLAVGSFLAVVVASFAVANRLVSEDLDLSELTSMDLDQEGKPVPKRERINIAKDKEDIQENATE